MSARGLLLAYPRAWRERYGEELLAMVEEDLGEGRASLRLRAELLRTGARERLRGSGAGSTGSERGRSGARLALVAWALMVPAGCIFAKATEHWQQGAPAGRLAPPQDAYRAVQALAATGAAAVIGTTLLLLAALLRRRAQGSLQELRGPALAAISLAAAFACAGALLVAVAGSLNSAQRNGGSDVYAALFAATGLLGLCALAALTRLALRCERLLAPTRALRRLEWAAATLVAALVPALALAMSAWRLSLPPASAGGGAVELAAVAALAAAACLLAAAAAARLVIAAREGFLGA